IEKTGPDVDTNTSEKNQTVKVYVTMPECKQYKDQSIVIPPKLANIKQKTLLDSYKRLVSIINQQGGQQRGQLYLKSPIPITISTEKDFYSGHQFLDPNKKGPLNSFMESYEKSLNYTQLPFAESGNHELLLHLEAGCSLVGQLDIHPQGSETVKCRLDVLLNYAKGNCCKSSEMNTNTVWNWHLYSDFMMSWNFRSKGTQIDEESLYGISNVGLMSLFSASMAWELLGAVRLVSISSLPIAIHSDGIFDHTVQKALTCFLLYVAFGEKEDNLLTFLAITHSGEPDMNLTLPFKWYTQLPSLLSTELEALDNPLMMNFQQLELPYNAFKKVYNFKQSHNDLAHEYIKQWKSMENKADCNLDNQNLFQIFPKSLNPIYAIKMSFDSLLCADFDIDTIITEHYEKYQSIFQSHQHQQRQNSKLIHNLEKALMSNFVGAMEAYYKQDEDLYEYNGFGIAKMFQEHPPFLLDLLATLALPPNNCSTLIPPTTITKDMYGKQYVDFEIDVEYNSTLPTFNNDEAILKLLHAQEDQLPHEHHKLGLLVRSIQFPTGISQPPIITGLLLSLGFCSRLALTTIETSGNMRPLSQKSRLSSPAPLPSVLIVSGSLVSIFHVYLSPVVTVLVMLEFAIAKDQRIALYMKRLVRYRETMFQ
ncbi:hypothetical protein KI387_016906, partial [Taxus chinensis]